MADLASRLESAFDQQWCFSSSDSSRKVGRVYHRARYSPATPTKFVPLGYPGRTDQSLQNRDNIQNSNLFGGVSGVLTPSRSLGLFGWVVAECGSRWEDYGSLLRTCVSAYAMNVKPILPMENCGNVLASHLSHSYSGCIHLSADAVQSGIRSFSEDVKPPKWHRNSRSCAKSHQTTTCKRPGSSKAWVIWICTHVVEHRRKEIYTL